MPPATPYNRRILENGHFTGIIFSYFINIIHFHGIYYLRNWLLTNDISSSLQLYPFNKHQPIDAGHKGKTICKDKTAHRYQTQNRKRELLRRHRLNQATWTRSKSPRIVSKEYRTLSAIAPGLRRKALLSQ